MSNDNINDYAKKSTQPTLKPRSFSEIPQYYRHIRREIVSIVPTNCLKILDVGCGAGMLGKALKEQNSQRLVVGIEMNEEAFYYAQINIDQAYQAELETFDPPFSQGEFDCIIFADILEHLKNPWEITRRYATFLNPGGLMIVSIPNIRYLPILRQVAELGSWQYQDEGILDRTHLRFFTKNSFIELLDQANIACNSVFYLGGQELHPPGPEGIVKLGNLSLANVSEEDFRELWAYQILFKGVYQPITAAVKSEPQSSKFTGSLGKINSGKVSLVVPWWDHSDLLEVWELNLKHLEDIEIIFIDNGSAAQAKVELQEFCSKHNIRLIRNETNRGFSAANNQGTEIATGEYILFLNNDVELLNMPIESLCEMSGDGIAGPGLRQNELGETYVEGWALCIKKSTLQALQGWCEDYGPGYWDDVDLCHRARLAGYTITPIPDINKWMQHKQNTTGRDGRLDQIALHIRNREIFIKKYHSIQPKIIVDGVFFQLYKTGIARVWKSLLEEWVMNGFAQNVVVIDRGGTAPKITGIRYRLEQRYDYDRTDADREMLQQVCDEESADLFISTYYTTPITTSSVFMAYDMIPEVLGANFEEPMWREKHHAIQHASAHIAISENTARDLLKFFPKISPEAVTVAHCGVKSSFSSASLEEVSNFKIKYGISKPYFMGVGVSSGYKNTILFLKAFAQLYSKNGFEIIFTGGGSLLKDELRAYTSGSIVHMLQLSDQELKAAYSGAVALVYPSLYEGFGLPILEAFACGCPVITCPNASIPEVAGEAVLYVNDDDVNGMANAICDVQKPDIRQLLITTGLEQARKFTWSKMAQIMSSALIEATLTSLNLRDINLIVFPDWSASEESIYQDLEAVIKALATHHSRNHITLLIDTTAISGEDANLFLSGVAMNLLMEEDLDITEELKISIVEKLDKTQWEVLFPRIQARIVLENENQEAIEQASLEALTSYELETAQFFFT